MSFMTGSNSTTRLTSKIGYERWALKKLENEYEVFPDEGGKIKFKADGNVEATISAKASMSQGRVEEVIESIYPLVFSGAYKSIDMTIEWLLEESRNQTSHKWGYTDKLDMVTKDYSKNDLPLPQWLSGPIFERFINLYDELREYRHSVIHGDGYTMDNGVLTVEHNDNQSDYRLNDKQLFSLGMASVECPNFIISGAPSEMEKRSLKQYFDNLDFIHEKGKFNCAVPWSQIIEYHASILSQDPIRCRVNLDEIHGNPSCSSKNDGYFLRVIADPDDIEYTIQWKIPSDEIDDSSELELTPSNNQYEEYREKMQ